MTAAEILLFCMLLTLGLGLFVAEAPARRRWARVSAILLVNLLIAAYVVWRFNWTLPSVDGTVSNLWPWIFFAFEMIAVLYEMWSLFVLCRITDHTAEADQHQQRLWGSSSLPTVDVLIPSYSEGPEILEATLRGTSTLNYPRCRDSKYGYLMTAVVPGLNRCVSGSAPLTSQDPRTSTAKPGT